jgi:AmmeMemoRadiSam system protein A
MCGGGPVAALLLFAEKAGRPKVEILARTDSSGSGGPVVGYLAAAVLSGTETGADAFSLAPDARSELLRLARSAVSEFVGRRAVIEDRSGRAEFAEPRGAFVTLRKRGELRGCIGFIEPVAPLGRAVIQAAIFAATEDPRFPPVAASEIADLRIEISVLTPARRRQPAEVTVGTHGSSSRDGRKGPLPQWSRTAGPRLSRQASLRPGR